MARTTQPNYDQLVKKAEAAVAAVKDPELKRAAFEKILDDLLGRGPAPEPLRARSQKVGRLPAKSGRSGPQAYVNELIEDGFFKKPQTIAAVKAELANRGHHIAITSLSGPLQKLCQRRSLRRQRAKTHGNKQTYNYSNW
jgi:hypothetical protein